MEFRAGERCGPGIMSTGGSRRSASAAVHPCPRRFMVADGGRNRAPSSIRTRWSARHETSPTKRARADQIARRDERRVGVALAQALHHARMVSDAGRHHDLFILSLGSRPDSAGSAASDCRGIIDCENAQLDRRGIGESARRDRRVRSRRPPAKGIDRSCAIIKRRRDDFTKLSAQLTPR